MKAFILNSGLGKRMAELTEDNHKSMVKLLNGETIFGRQIRILSECGIRDFIITVGYLKEQLIDASKSFPHLNFKFVDNKDYKSTNYIYSMFLAHKYLEGDMLFLHGDLVFNKRLVTEILSNKNDSLCLINDEKELAKKDFKGRIQKGYLKEVSVNIFDNDCFTFQPLYKLSGGVVNAWKNEVEIFIRSGDNKVYAENALNQILDRLQIKAISYKEHYIEEVDNADDYKRVSEEIRYYDYREQPVFKYNNVEAILKSNNICKILLVGSNSNVEHIKSLLHESNYNYVCFDGFSSNPKYEEIKEGTNLFKKEKCNFIISVGGGSCMDTAKSIKLLSASANEQDFLDGRFTYSSVKHLAIPTTAGTGSESTRFAVIYRKGKKLSPTHDTILPEYAVLNYEYLITLPDYFKKAAMLDSLCQAIESYWSRQSSDESKEYSVSAIRLIISNYKEYLNNNTDALKKMLVASNMSGKAINITTTTAPHAMSYKLTSLYGISHGHAVALVLPVVWRFMLRNADNYEGLMRSFMGIANALGCETIESAIQKFEDIYSELYLSNPIVTNNDDIGILVGSVNIERLNNNPIPISREDIEQMYTEVLR